MLAANLKIFELKWNNRLIERPHITCTESLNSNKSGVALVHTLPLCCSIDGQ